MIIDDRARFFLQVAEKLPKAFNSTASRISTAAKKALKLGLFSCERAPKRCISGGKNGQKYGIYPFDKLEFDKLYKLDKALSISNKTFDIVFFNSHNSSV